MTKKVKLEQVTEPTEEQKTTKKFDKQKLPITVCFGYSGIKTEKGFYVSKITEMKEWLGKVKLLQKETKASPKAKEEPVHQDQ